VPPEGLSVNELRELRQRYGSLEQAAVERPELADQIRAHQRVAEKIGQSVAKLQQGLVESVRLPLMTAPKLAKIDHEAIREHQIEMRAEAYERALRRVGRTKGDTGPQAATEVDPRSNPEPYRRSAFWQAVGSLIEGVPLAEIGRRTKLSKKQVTKIRDWHAHPSELGPRGGPGYRLDPGPTSATVVLLKLRKRRSS
jgi:hypothetical protein